MERFKHAENMKDLSVNMTLSTTLRPTIIITDIIIIIITHHISFSPIGPLIYFFQLDIFQKEW